MAIPTVLLLLLTPPLLASCLAIVVRPYRRFVGLAGLATAVVSLAASIVLCVMVAGQGSVPASDRPTDLFRADALSALLALCVSSVTLMASASAETALKRRTTGAGSDEAPASESSQVWDDASASSEARRFRIFMHAFAFTMLAAVTVQNVALMWVAIEATTITSAMLIPLHRTKTSVEASWKYILICSVGIALAFAGTVLAYCDFIATAGEVPGALNWTVLRAAAPSLHPELLRLSFAFTVIGYGTKAGLAPMHTWLPDAHSEAPSPISAMMSGVLLAVAMYAIARWKAVVDLSAAAGFTGTLLIGVGVASVVIGTFSLVIQRHYKRMLAYSSVEHMGLVSIGLALGPLGVFAAWLHVVNHAAAKSICFLLSGRILHRYQTTEIDKVRGLMQVMPWTGGLFASGVLALVGLPPFGLFVSEFLLVRASIVTRHFWLAGTIVVLLLVAFVSLVRHLNRMLYGDVPDGVAVGEPPGWPIVLLFVPAVVLVVLGVVLPSSVSLFIDRCVEVLTR